jgi:hypothetical protein
MQHVLGELHLLEKLEQLLSVSPIFAVHHRRCALSASPGLGDEGGQRRLVAVQGLLVTTRVRGRRLVRTNLRSVVDWFSGDK